VSLVLVPDVFDYAWNVMPVEGGGVVAAGPADGTGNTSIGAHRSRALREPDKIAEACVGPEADEQVNVVSQNGATEHPRRGPAARARDRTPDIARGGSVQASDALPGVPRDVGVQLIRMMSGHRDGPQSGAPGFVSRDRKSASRHLEPRAGFD
jgi:hypothetical protein